MTIYYTYKLVHRQDGRFYIGSRVSEIDPYQDLGIKYKSSGTKVKDIGFENLYYGVIEIYNDHDSAYWCEQKMIKDNIKNPLCLNRSIHQSNHKS